jgi:hypothetical protein
MEWLFLIVIVFFAFYGGYLIGVPHEAKTHEEIPSKPEPPTQPKIYTPYDKIYLPWDIRKRLDRERYDREKFLKDLDEERRRR